MSLGNFYLGSKVIIPLQVLEGGSPSTSNLVDVRIEEMIKPDLSKDSDFPKGMTLVSSDRATYNLEYTPKSIGNYIAIITLSINSITYSQIESFYVSQGNFTGNQAPIGKPVSSNKAYTMTRSSEADDDLEAEDKEIKKVIVQDGLSSAAPTAKPVK